MHPFLNFKSSSEYPHRATFASKQGYTYGIEIVNEVVGERMNLHQLERDGLGYDPYCVIEQSLSQSSETIFFFNVLKNRLDTQVKRGAIVKALAVGCRKKVMLEPLSRMLEATLDLIYDA